MQHDPLVVSLRQTPEPQTYAPPVQQLYTPPNQNHGILRNVLTLGLLVFFVATGWYAYRHTALFAGSPEPGSQAAAALEAAAVVEKVGLLIDLPEGEEPTVATVSDPGKLKDQPFFANAKSGDRVLLYTKAHKAYLYDPVRHKLVEVAPFTTDIQP